MSALRLPGRQTIDQIRNHLLAPGHEPRKWTKRSLAPDPHVRVSIIASRDLGEREVTDDDLNSGYAFCFHLSFTAWRKERRVQLPARDLESWAPVALDFLAPYAAVQLPVPVGHPKYVSDMSPFTTHVYVYFDGDKQPMVPEGAAAFTPWRVSA